MTFFSKEYQKFIIELKLVAHLVPKLMDTVKELNKNLASIIKIPWTVVTAASGKHVTKRAPIFFNEHLKAFESSIIWVQK